MTDKDCNHNRKLNLGSILLNMKKLIHQLLSLANIATATADISCLLSNENSGNSVQPLHAGSFSTSQGSIDPLHRAAAVLSPVAATVIRVQQYMASWSPFLCTNSRPRAATSINNSIAFPLLKRFLHSSNIRGRQ